MNTAIIGTKNQIVIPKSVRDKISGLKPGRKVSIYSPDSETVIIKANSSNWLESSYGLMESAWSDKDPIKQLEENRNTW